METTPEDVWHSSSYSGGSGGNCLEIARWRKSTYSGGSGDNCLEVAIDRTAVVPVRDSKNPGSRVTFQAEAWSAFVGAIKAAPAPK
ncbi:DUF397 domain-containing protein [Streptomyces sp. Alain-F2R5]|uniref:DUF397 domain-containing protein n=1 Tax=Streptomyces TaxID=1883 RepID=UPI000A25F58F|nr:MULTISPECIES: DUF397 domain-containing protein [unclassified Streptomyces]MDG9692614.1 DUF397 domain-containing protein [Streptomyces sp. DH17]OSC61539.1 DUF397 domain-containing protein [Streptomyces sp. 4F]MDN3245587.1 DUF397 domain-containing protein [Streptomyces sp. ZSW22]PAK23389.1 DUF397 domain-containing protein [Streptomyces sp. alain-838]PAM99945.1 DUF397 domain-containing protein [Streptomyces sp. Alain-F2R5]